jgi:predicted amidophosphoribosyltransferase
MQNVLKFIQRQIECPLCLKCGSFFITRNYFCETCTDDFLISQVQIRSENLTTDLKVTSFFSWVKYESDSLSELIYLLKTSSSLAAWNWFVQYFESEICQIVDTKQASILIPIPGLKRSYHTKNLALEIQNLTGCKSISLLRKSDQKMAQKTKSALDRNQIQFEICEDFTEELNTISRIYLIDDIVTTGATLRSASSAIKSHLSKTRNGHIQISALALFHRTKLDVIES